MKNFILSFFLIASIGLFSQETFVKKYTSMISKKGEVLQPWKKINVTVVFNPKGVRDIVIYFSKSKKLKLHQINGVTEGKTDNGEGYQLIECIDHYGGKVAIQLFDDDTCLRILIAKGYMIEFHND